jgi:hypothetical protein
MVDSSRDGSALHRWLVVQQMAVLFRDGWTFKRWLDFSTDGWTFKRWLDV